VVIAGTGHRPPRLAINGLQAYSQRQFGMTCHVALQWLQKSGVENATVISGCALGWDTALAWSAQLTGIPVICAVPYLGYKERWGKRDQGRFWEIIENAAQVHYVCEPGYAAWKNIKRDEWMVDRCDTVLALFDGVEKGGTWRTVEYARGQGKPVVNLWDSFVGQVKT
jgi:uncharacterized phage-like protein YoqJ